MSNHPRFNDLSKMIARRIQYDHMRHKVLQEYIQRRRDGLYRARYETHARLEEQAKFASERGDFWLEVVRRDIMRDLDELALDLDIVDLDLSIDLDDLDAVRASEDRRDRTIFPKSPDFFSSFDIFKR